MKFKIFLFQLMGICFAGLTSVVGASPLDTIPPPITDFFIPVNQRSVAPVRNPGDFIGRVFAPKPEDWKTRPEAQPITGVTVTIASGPRAGESVATNPSGYYRFPNVIGDELHLRVEKEHFEPKEVRVHRWGPTILANGDVLNYKSDPQQHTGNILIGQRWPEEVRFIFEEILVVHDLLYVEGGRPPEGKDLGGFYSLGVIVLYSYQYADWKDEVGLLGTFAHEIAHAHQHATVSVDGSAWAVHGWKDTPEGRAYEEARRKDWEQVGKSRLDNIYGRGGGGGVALTETAAETCAHYWSVDRWGGRTAYGLLEVEAPNRYKWAEKWVPISIPVRPPPKVVSIPDPNLATALRETLGFDENVRISDRALQSLTELDARKNQIKDLTGLEHATRLRRLILDDNQVRDITPLENLPQLTWLHMSGNPISDFTPLVNLNQLERLALWGDNIDDVALLANKTKLTHLWLGENNVSDITPLENLTQLKLLYLPHNQIRDVTPLAGLTNLETLHLQDNSIRDISPLAGLTKLTDLRLGDNPITDKSPLRTLKERNPELKVDIEIPPLSPIVHVDAANRPPLYWVGATTGTLHRLVGDEVENLVPNVKNVTSLAVDIASGQLYWTEKTSDRTGRIKRANLDGTNVRLVKKLTSVPYGIALDTVNRKLYLTNAYGKVQRLNVDGSNFQPNLITDLDTPRNLVLDVTGGKVYWTETTEASGRVRRANLNGSGVQNVATGLVPPQSLAVANSKIYWTEGTTENAGKLHRANLDGTNSELLETLPSASTGIAVDTGRNSLYLTARSGEIHRRDLDDSGDEPIVTGLVAPSNIVLGITATTPGPTDAPEPATTPAVDAATDVNKDQKVNKTDLLLVVTALGEKPPANPNVDVNADGAVNIADVLRVIEVLDDPIAAAAPTLEGTVAYLDPALLTAWIDILRAESDGSMKYEHAIAFFQGLLASIRPTETRLLANYPNPFNPETWIPYHLANPSNVRITIYNIRGSIVRRLDLAHQREGYYTSRNRAAYWDGRNALGESVASGVYFYTLTAGEFTATRKMLIKK